MTQQIINIGNAPNDGTGDPLRTAFTICNSNFSELYSVVNADTGNILAGNVTATGTISAAGNVTADIVIATGDYVVIPVGSSDPLSPVPGATYFNNVSSKIRVYNGTAWIEA
jgi:hypothetical protein